MRSRFMISMFFSAIAHITGWPPNVIPCEYIDVSARKGSITRSVAAVRVRDVAYLRHERLEGDAERGDAVDREGAEGRPVVGDLARDRLVAALGRSRDALVVARLALCAAERRRDALGAARLVVLARELPRRLDRLRPAGDEEDAVEVAGRERGDLLRELDRAGMRVRPVRVERQLAHLLERGLADLLAVAVADVDGEEARERVEV